MIPVIVPVCLTIVASFVLVFAVIGYFETLPRND
jgi:hypothetical protein